MDLPDPHPGPGQVRIAVRDRRQPGLSLTQLTPPAAHEQVIVAVASGEPSRQDHGRDRLVSGEQAARPGTRRSMRRDRRPRRVC